MNKGSKMTEEQRRRVSEAQRKRFSNPEERKRAGESSKKVWINPELRKRQSEVQKRRFLNPEEMEKSSESHKGQVAWNRGKTGIYSEETRRKIGLASKGRKLSEEHKRKIRENASRNPNFGMKGKHFSEETKRKLSLSHKGQIPKNLEQLRLLSIGHKVSEDARRKISLANTGRKHSKEAIEKNRLAHLGKPAWNKGIPTSKEQVEKWKKSMQNVFASSEFRSRIGESNKKRWADSEYKSRMKEIHKIRLSNPEEMKRQGEVSRRTLLKLYESGAFPKQTDTKPERMIKEELIKRGYKEGIDFFHQYKFMNKFMLDFCFPQKKVIVEAYGDFWHCNPAIYPEPIHLHQKKGIGRDKSKEAYIRKVDNGSWDLIILWESDIKKNVSECVDKIEEVLRQKGGS